MDIGIFGHWMFWTMFDYLYLTTCSAVPSSVVLKHSRRFRPEVVSYAHIAPLQPSSSTKDIAAIVSFQYLVFSALVRGLWGFT